MNSNVLKRLTSSKKKHFFVHIPQAAVEKIGRELNVNPSVSEVEIITLWCLASWLTADMFFDYRMAGCNNKEILEILRAETDASLEELEKQE